MKSTWRPSLSVKEALAICGSLSNPGKMPGHGYALPAHGCRLGSFLQQLPKAVCHYCYALRGRYLFPRVRAAMEKRVSSLTDHRWVEAVSTLIYRSRDRYFRWHDSGDLQDLEHLQKIIQVCKNLPHVRFWLPTREYQTVEAPERRRRNSPESLYPLFRSPRGWRATPFATGCRSALFILQRAASLPELMSAQHPSEITSAAAAGPAGIHQRES
jgi:hypothetical protein